jgi:hypothetical protein
MVLLQSPLPKHQRELGSPFCTDPNCAYCAELRKMFEQMRKQNGSVKDQPRQAKLG